MGHFSKEEKNTFQTASPPTTTTTFQTKPEKVSFCNDETCHHISRRKRANRCSVIYLPTDARFYICYPYDVHLRYKQIQTVNTLICKYVNTYIMRLKRPVPAARATIL